jgi:hypothetical protein
MPTVEYTKKRDLVSGSVGDAETIEFDTQDNEPFSRPETQELMTMGKAVSAVNKHIMQGWQVTTVPVTYSASNLAIWREFLHSCAARESFLYDPTGTVASPGANIVTVTLVPREWRFNRIGPNLMTISMVFEETSP